MPGLADALEQAGGPDAGREHAARLRDVLDADLAKGAAELGKPRSGYGAPVLAAFGSTEHGLVAVLPVPATARADVHSIPERAWLVVAAAVDALHQAGGDPGADVRAGAFRGHLVLARPGDEPELAALAFDEAVSGVDRLRARAAAVPAHVLEGEVADLREPMGASHPLRVADAVARLGGHPADPASVHEHEDAILALQASTHGVARPHEDPDPPKRIARRILQRLDGMGKWGGYHTDFAHLARGFAGNERALADQVGEALLQAGLLSEKPSVGQRHVFLNPRRAGDVRRLIDDGDVPGDLRLP